MKFMSLFKKELREMLTPQTIIVLVMIYVGMFMLGNVMGKQIDKIVEESSEIVLCDNDDTSFTKSMIEAMKKPDANTTNTVKLVKLESDDYPAELDRLGEKYIVIIPKGFTEQVKRRKTTEKTDKMKS